jgi:hypothetical protein
MAGLNKKKSRTKYFALGVVALLAAGGLLAATYVNASDQAANSSTSTGPVFSGEYLEIVVWTYSGGQRIPISDANVTVYAVSEQTAPNGTITLTLTPAAANSTNAHGAAYFNLASGKYAAIAIYDGHRGLALFALNHYKTVFVRLR